MPRFTFSEPRMQMTPMIDVVFLLLIFFMLSTTFIRALPDESVEPPQAAHLAGDDQARRRLVLNIRPDGTLTVDGRTVGVKTLGELIEAAEGPVVVRADAGAAHAHTLQVLDVCARSGLQRVKLVIVRKD